MGPRRLIVRALLARGWTQKAAGRRYGVARSTAGDIARGKRWRRVD